jgi:aminoglycoside/choline kinase family phosphotransferase
MDHAEPLSHRHPARMSLSPEQHSHVAAAYDKAAFDISLPAQTRAAFAKKADWFRLLARIDEKRERVARNGRP